MCVKARAASNGMKACRWHEGLQTADPLVETKSEPCPIEFQRWPILENLPRRSLPTWNKRTDFYPGSIVAH